MPNTKSLFQSPFTGVLNVRVSLQNCTCMVSYDAILYGGLFYGSKVHYLSDHEISYSLGKYIEYFTLMSNNTHLIPFYVNPQSMIYKEVYNFSNYYLN